MFTITDRTFLRSLQREAGRQFDFFERRGDASLADHWAELENLATEAVQKNAHLIINVGSQYLSPSIIKPCEQAQQLLNPLTRKALQ